MVPQNVTFVIQDQENLNAHKMIMVHLIKMIALMNVTTNRFSNVLLKLKINVSYAVNMVMILTAIIQKFGAKGISVHYTIKFKPI